MNTPETLRHQLDLAETEYAAAVKAYHDAEADGRSSFCEHNHASYWKGRRDALRALLKNHEESADVNPPMGENPPLCPIG